MDPQVCQGQACIRGLRIPVSLVLKHLAAGRTPEQIVDDFPELEVEDVREALRYASWLASGLARIRSDDRSSVGGVRLLEDQNVSRKVVAPLSAGDRSIATPTP